MHPRVRSGNPAFSLGYPFEDNGLQYTAAGWVIFNKWRRQYVLHEVERRERKKGQMCLFRLIHRRKRRDITSVTVFWSHTGVWAFLKPLTANIRGVLESRAGVSSSSGSFLPLFVFCRKMFVAAQGFSFCRARLFSAEKKTKKQEGEKTNLQAERANKLARVQGLLIVWKMSCFAQEDCVARNYAPTTDNTADASATQTLYMYLFLFFKEWSNIRWTLVQLPPSEPIQYNLQCLAESVFSSHFRPLGSNPCWTFLAVKLR